MERVILRLRAITEPDQDQWPHFDKFRDLFRVKGPGKSTCRIFCCLRRGRPPVLVLLCGVEGKPPKPHDAYSTAKDRRNQIKEGRACTHEFDYGQME